MSRPKRLFHGFLRVAAGAVAVVGGAYVFSRIREKQESETRLDRLEQIVEEVSKEKQEK